MERSSWPFLTGDIWPKCELNNFLEEKSEFGGFQSPESEGKKFN
jgi:hypothetical protein